MRRPPSIPTRESRARELLEMTAFVIVVSYKALAKDSGHVGALLAEILFNVITITVNRLSSAARIHKTVKDLNAWAIL